MIGVLFLILVIMGIIGFLAVLFSISILCLFIFTMGEGKRYKPKK